MRIFLDIVAAIGWTLFVAWFAWAKFFKESSAANHLAWVTKPLVPSVLIILAVVQGANRQMGWLQITGFLVFAILMPWNDKSPKP